MSARKGERDGGRDIEREGRQHEDYVELQPAREAAEGRTPRSLAKILEKEGGVRASLSELCFQHQIPKEPSRVTK